MQPQGTTAYSYIYCTQSVAVLSECDEFIVLKHFSLHLLVDYNVISSGHFIYVFKAERSETMQSVFETIIR